MGIIVIILRPCLYMIDNPNVKFNLDAIGISHFDLDTFGECYIYYK